MSRYTTDMKKAKGGRGGGGESGTVTSVALSAPTGLTVGGSPFTGSGTLALTFTAGYSIPTTTKQGEWDTRLSQPQVMGRMAFGGF